MRTEQEIRAEKTALKAEMDKQLNAIDTAKVPLQRADNKVRGWSMPLWRFIKSAVKQSIKSVNMKLISAAPHLLNLCEKAFETLNPGKYEHAELWSELNEAIKKATE